MERLEEVPQVLYEERPVEVPSIQVAEAMRQEPCPQVHEVRRTIPRSGVDYRGLVEVPPLQRSVPAPLQTAVEWVQQPMQVVDFELERVPGWQLDRGGPEPQAWQPWRWGTDGREVRPSTGEPSLGFATGPSAPWAPWPSPGSATREFAAAGGWTGAPPAWGGQVPVGLPCSAHL
mmetsp:Transcript_35308/g.100850  ORF Transcript_35308/g.100850 Transcript_35308/m.100850 type:complete len:175 (-) Transcript_35308:2-526(-)